MYAAPPGWVEQFRVDHGERLRRIFHVERECPKVRDAEGLRAVTRPGAAARCPFCARVD